MRNNEAGLSSVERALKLLILLRERRSISVTEAAAALSVTPPTAYRLLATLRNEGFATQDSERRYRVGPHLDAAQPSTLTPQQIRRALHPRLAGVQARLNETVNLWILEGVNVRNIDGVESTEALAIRVNAYDLVPAYSSAAGKALLACHSNEDIERMHPDGLPQWRAQAIPSMPDLKRHLQLVRRLGYATNIEEAVQGVCGVGVAIKDDDGSAVVALSCGVPGQRFSRPRRTEIAQALLEAAAGMSERLARASLDEALDS